MISFRHEIDGRKCKTNCRIDFSMLKYLKFRFQKVMGQNLDGSFKEATRSFESAFLNFVLFDDNNSGEIRDQTLNQTRRSPI